MTCGEDAVAAVAQTRFDLVLTDIHMPGLDGIEATRRIRANEASLGRARTPIVALTADALETGKRACQEAGMDGFLTKPVNPTELDAMLADLFPSCENACGARRRCMSTARRGRAAFKAYLEPRRAGHAGARLFERPALPADRQHLRLLAARSGHDTGGHRLSVLGGHRLFAQVSLGAADRPRRCAAVLRQVGTPAGLDGAGAADRRRRAGRHGRRSVRAAA